MSHGQPIRAVVAIAIAVTACTGERTSARGDNVDDARELTRTEVLRIGSADDPAVGFTSIRGVDVDRDGNIYIGERSDSEIRVYDASGQLIRRIGRKGSGPGEFETLPAFGVVGDTVWSYEGGRQRIVLFSREGHVITTGIVEPVLVPLQPPQGGIGHVTPLGLRNDGTFASHMPSVRWTMRDPPSGLAETDTARIPRVRFAATGRVIDTVGWELRPPLPPKADPAWADPWVTFKNLRYRVPSPSPGGTWHVPLIDGHILIDAPIAPTPAGAEFQVTRLSLKGDTLRRTTYRYTPRRYPDALLDSLAWQSARVPGGGIRWVDGVRENHVLTADTVDVFKAVRAAMSFPGFQQPVQSYVVGRNGELWVVREDAGDGRERWLVLRADGSVRGTVAFAANGVRGGLTVNPRATLVWADRDAVLVVERDENDIPWVVRYQLR